MAHERDLMAERLDERRPLMAGSEDRRGQFLKDATDKVRQGFVRKVYGILSAQLILTVLLALPIVRMSEDQVRSHRWILAISLAAMVVTMCVMCCCREALRKYPTNYMVFGLLTVAIGISVGFSSAMYTPQSVVFAAGVTAGIFLCLSIVAWTTNIDFTGLGIYFVAAGLALSIFGLAITITSFFTTVEWAVMAYDFLAVLLFTFYIIFDTQLIIGGENREVQYDIDDYTFAAMNLYLDIINLFLHLLSLFGKRR